MPASSSETLSHIEESLKSSLSKGDSFDTKLVASSKKILLHKIDFKPAEGHSSFQLEQLRAKYTPLNSSDNSSGGIESKPNGQSQSGMNGNKEVCDGLPAPNRILYPPERLKLEWPSVRRIGPGLHNPANTCFVNSTLQCLTYTPPLANYLCSDEHTRTCKSSDFCLVCELQKHVKRCFNECRPFEPTNVIRKLKLIAKHLQYGRQEDAHEFLRYVVDGMQKSCLNGFAKLDRFSKETTVINQIFGGFLRSQVLCLQCKARSNTFDPLLDISLDVKSVPNIQKALEKYVQPEKLDADNAYNCPKCKQKVPAQKRFSIHRAPNVLTIQLKRFDFSRIHGKVTKHVQFPEKLDIRPYMSQRQGEPSVYHLYGVLVHSGFSAQHGHYYSYVRGSNLVWYLMNDACVNQVNINRVLSAEAYLLFYIKHKLSSHPFSQRTMQNHLIGPKLPPTHSTAPHTVTKLCNGPIGQPVNDVGQPLSRKPASALITNGASTLKPGQPTRPAMRPSTIPSLQQRDKITFDIRPKDHQKSLPSEKPRIVMHIRNGKVDYNSVAEKQKNAANSGTSLGATSGAAQGKPPKRLVPYNGESSDSEAESPQQPQSSSQSAKSPSKQPQSSDWSGKNGKKSPSPEKKNPTARLFEPILDDRLNATTRVPGAYGRLDKDVGNTAASLKSEHRRSVDSVSSQSTHPNPRSLRRSLSDNSGLSICTEAPRVNATTKWNIFDGSSQVSPSVASASSSNASINSTTGWHVTANGHKPKLMSPPKVQHAGWTVTPKKNVPFRNKASEVVEQQSQQPNLNIKLKRHSSNEDLYADEENKLSSHGRKTEVKLNGHKHEAEPSTADVLNPKKVNGYHNDRTEELVMNGAGDATSENWLKNHKNAKKKKKKHKKSKYDDSEEEDQHHTKKNKKKKKKKKRRKDEEERPLLESDSDSPSPAHRKRRGSSETETERKRAKYDYEDNNTDYVWVEKTKATIEKAQHKDKEVPVQEWDHHFQESSRNKKHAESTHKPGGAWDGSRSSNADIVKELQKMTSRGYGAQVTSWEGGKSHLDQDLDREKQWHKTKTWEEEYEEDLDRGKDKKTKYPSDHHHSHNHKNNAFQKYQDVRNADKEQNHTAEHHSWDKHRDQDRASTSSTFGGSKGGRDRTSLYSPDRDRERPSWASPGRSSSSNTEHHGSHGYHRHQHHHYHHSHHRNQHHDSSSSSSKHGHYGRHH